MLLSVFSLLSSSYMVRATCINDTSSFVMNKWVNIAGCQPAFHKAKPQRVQRKKAKIISKEKHTEIKKFLRGKKKMIKREMDIHKGEYLITFRVPKDHCQTEEQEATIRLSCIFLNFWCLSSSKCLVLCHKFSQKENIKLFLPSHSFQVSPWRLFSCCCLTRLAHWKTAQPEKSLFNKVSVIRNSGWY